ncbi:HIT domain-containing protein [Brevibacterium aurantiacum]|uniref:HIT domain-containing protein n=2 Tax=Brevibacterium aurantiacum TaxID=273384 RepID=UPI000F09F19C
MAQSPQRSSTTIRSVSRSLPFALWHPRMCFCFLAHTTTVSPIFSSVRSSPRVGRLMRRAAEIAAQRGLNERGYRLVWNFGPDTKQRITHPHLHLLGGTLLREELA